MIGRSRPWNAPARMRRAPSTSWLRSLRPTRGPVAWPTLAPRWPKASDFLPIILPLQPSGSTGAHFRNAKDLTFLVDALREAGLPEWPFSFSADEHDRLNGDAIARLVLGHTLQGHIEPGFAGADANRPGRQGRRSGRRDSSSPRRSSSIETNCARRAKICSGAPTAVLSTGVGSVAGEPSYAYVNSGKVFYFSPVK